MSFFYRPIGDICLYVISGNDVCYLYSYNVNVTFKQLKKTIYKLPSIVSPIFSLFSSPHLAHTFSLKNATLFTGQPWCIFPGARPSTIIPRPAGDLFGFIEVEKFNKTPRAVEAIIFPAAVGETHGKNRCWLDDSPGEKKRDVMVIEKFLWRVRCVFLNRMMCLCLQYVFFGDCRPAHVLQ